MNDTRLGLGQIGTVATVIQHAAHPKRYRLSKTKHAEAMTALESWNARARAAGYADAQAWLNAGVARSGHADALPADLREKRRAVLEAIREGL